MNYLNTFGFSFTPTNNNGPNVPIDNSAKLIETGVYKHMENTLQQCRERRTTLFHIGLNIGVFVIFAMIFGTTLYVCYTQKKSPYETYQKQLKDQEYVLSKIRFYQGQIRNPMTASSISGLPAIDEPVSRAYPF